MSNLTRRSFAFAALAALPALAACSGGVGNSGPAQIDARVDATLSQMYSQFPGTRDLAQKSAGMLVMPLITEAGFGLGGGYGRGALRVGGGTVEYYSATQANVGLQIGAQQYAHVLFFMTQEALAEFRRSDGWVASADAEVVFSDQGETLRADTTTSLSPVIAVIFAQAGLKIGATVEGLKYSRILP
ncbi:lipid-binding SYLF domain-containing protein [Pseudooceanicola spongiae]|jgi:lipid-binding SYLF domain-containing protein|uniref:Twin-arginine translocation pathway signal n=1 Tax=Pseudooceanicola spongiae TaxID=2613965 RepID=A0A7L9WKD1_9RHOB|nr:YSC84-related protein [Pseudooceanicola spongiae]QOL80177.1 twin-arginine translocation pathway signal [Pseudooceanicola spongiae]|tara:strand:+ start:172 stop:732 length:561 start_codon:yes stop_codon:yes gene_type:complete